MSDQLTMFPESGDWRNASDVITPKKDKRYRFQLRFWLDLEKSDEYWLAEYAALLKNNRGFARAIRNGLRLIHDLQQGKTDVLIELFPWIQEAFNRPSVFNEELLADLIAQRLHAQPTPRVLPAPARPALEVTRADAEDEDDFGNFMATYAALKN